MDRLDELLAFVTVIDAGSLAAAGRKLRRSPPAMTRALAALEARAGARLVERTTRRLRPTPAGQAFAAHARALLSGYGELLREGEGGVPRGLLRVTAPLVFGRRHVAPALVEFLAANPEVKADLVLDDRPLDLVGEGFDVAVRIGRLADSGLVARRVGAVRQVIVASPAYLARHPAPRTPADLARHDVVLSSQRLPEWRFGGGPRGRAVRLEPRLLVNGVEAGLVAVKAGHAIGRALSYQVSDDIAAGALVRLLREFEPPALPVQLVVPGGRHLPRRVAAFRDHAARALSRLEVLRAER
ncbi:MAG: LysR family transcriptional regulator [Anaeromyxobacter sp.]